MDEKRLHAVIDKFNEFNWEMKALMESNPLDENATRIEFETCLELLSVVSEAENCLDRLWRVAKMKNISVDAE